MRQTLAGLRGAAWSQAAVVCLASAGLLCLSGNLFIVSFESRRLYALLLLGALGAIAVPRRRGDNGSGRAAGAAVLLGAAAGILWARDPLPAVLLWAAALAGLSLLAPAAVLPRHCLGALGFALCWLASWANPLAFRGLDRLSEALSRGIGSLFLLRDPQVLGLSAGGLLTLLPFAAFYLSSFRKSARGAAGFGAAALGAWLLFQLTGKFVLSAFAQVTAQVVILPVVSLGFLWLRPSEPRVASPRARWAGLVVLAGALLPVVWGTFCFGDGPVRGRRILFSEDGYFDLKTPTFEKFGILEGGLFGLLPRYLVRYDYTHATVRGEVGPEHLGQADVLVVTNPTRVFGDGELKAIWEFVEGGGSLLVLGDHTDIMGSQAPLNRLLEPVGVRFLFDSGFPCRQEWKHCLEPRPHPATAWARTLHDYAVSVGATLEVDPPSIPVVVGKYGFSDEGNRYNVQGAFLGNYRYEPGEKLGDVVLVAAGRHGRGKVLVFGDTSPFQNGALAASFPAFVYPVFEWLVRPGSFGWDPRWLLAGWVVALGGLALFHRAAGRVEVLIALAALGVTAAAAQRSTAAVSRFEHRPGELAWVDLSHLERLALYPFQRHSAGALFQNLARNGYLPLAMERFSAADLNRGRVFVTVAPARPFSPDEQAALLSFLGGGGTVVVAAGYEEKGGSQGLLRAVGLDLAEMPLGPVPIVKDKDADEDEVQFVSAWPIVDVTEGKPRSLLRVRVAEGALTPGGAGTILRGAPREYVPVRNDVEVLYHHNGLALVAAAKVGKGELVVIADSLFLGEENLETMRAVKPGNILFLKSVFERGRRRSP